MVMKINIFLMVWLIIVAIHVLYDFNQGEHVATMKQKDWWKEHYPAKLYRHDYIIVLILHGLLWSVLVTIPIFVCRYYYHREICNGFILFFIIFNAMLHTLVDHAKANIKCINLLQDQLLHLIQLLGLATMIF